MATHQPDTVASVLLTLLVGSVATVYQDAMLVAIGAAFGGFLSLQRAPTRRWWHALWHVTQCFGLGVLLVDFGAAAVWAQIPQSWGMSKHMLMATVAGAIAWSWPESGQFAMRWIKGRSDK